MKSYLVAWFLALMVISAVAQPLRPASSAAPDAASGQRRSELREALRGTRAAEPRRLPGSEEPPVRRQLSVQERADLRQQLRQQGPQGKPERP